MAHRISQERQHQWKKDIIDQANSGLPVASWCRQNRIAVHTFYYWQNKLFPKDLDRSAFTEIVNEEQLNTPDSGVVLEYQGVKIHLSQNFEPPVLKRCLEVLKEC